MAYTTIGSVKRVLQLSESDTSLDDEITDVLPSGDALVDSLLKQKSLAVPNPVPQNLADAAAHFDAWIVRRRRDPVGAEAFWVEANRFLDAYTEAEAEPYVGSAQQMGSKLVKPKLFAGTLKLKDGSEFLVEIRVTPLDDGGAQATFTVEVSTRGLEFDEVASKFSKELRQKLIEKLANIAYASAFFIAPWKTGKLAGSIVKDIGDGEASIQTLAPYAMYVVKGTAPHVIRPVNASVLAFEVAGRMIFAPLVRHPGTKPNPFMKRAVEDARSKVDEVFADLWLEMLS